MFSDMHEEWERRLVEKTKKETAEKIFVVLINALLTRKERAKKFYSIKESAGVDMAIDTTKKIAKKFGVEMG